MKYIHSKSYFYVFQFGEKKPQANVKLLYIQLWDAVPGGFKLHEEIEAFWISLNILKIIKFISLYLFTAFHYHFINLKSKQKPEKWEFCCPSLCKCSLLMASVLKYYKPHFCLKMNVVSLVNEWHYINSEDRKQCFSTNGIYFSGDKIQEICFDSDENMESTFIVTRIQLGHSVLILPYSYLVLLLLNTSNYSSLQENVILLSCT